MTWATLAHITNDSLAVPLTVWLLVFLIRCTSRMDARNVAITAVVLSAGLLTKAYFVALAPLLFGICLIRRDWRRFMMAALIVAVCAGPWYVRNYRLYGVVMGTQDARGGIGLRAVLTRAPQMNWPKVAVDSVREALWTGNNSFRTFSLGTINTVIALCVVAFLLWLFTRHARPEWLVAAYCAVFGAALAYNGAAAEIMTRGASSTPAPWYSQVMVTPLLVLAALGTGRWRIGPLVAAAQALVFGYVLGATYVVKLIPLYAGYGGRGTAGDIAVLYRNFSALSERLGSVALKPAPLIFGLTTAVLLLIVAVEILLLHGLFGGRRDVPAVAINAQ